MSKRRPAGANHREGKGIPRHLLGGDEVTWDHDSRIPIDNKRGEIFPEIKIPEVAPPTEREKAAVAKFRAFRRHVREGPLYTVPLVSSARISKPCIAKAKAITNPFEDMPRYTQRYRRAEQTLPDFQRVSYTLQMFPKELHEVLGIKSQKLKPLKPKAPQSPRPKSDPQNSKPTARNARRIVDDDEDEDDNDEDNAFAAKRRRAGVNSKSNKHVKLNSKDSDDDEKDVEGDANADPDEVDGDEDPEDDFSNADSEMGGDYNAEQYFSGGESDNLDDDGGDGGGMGEGRHGEDFD